MRRPFRSLLAAIQAGVRRRLTRQRSGGAGQAVVSLPNGHRATVSLESRRGRILFHHAVGLARPANPEQLQFVLAGIRALLDGHPKVEPASGRAGLVRANGTMLDVEISAHVIDSTHAQFLAVQEELLLGVMAILDASDASATHAVG